MHARNARSAVQAIPRRDRILIGVCMVLVCVLGWTYIVQLGMRGSPDTSSPLSTMTGMGTTMGTSWRTADVLFTFTMWSVMMVGMMGTTAAPMLLLFAASYARRRTNAIPTVVVLFALGYITIWIGFSGAATFVQWALSEVTLLSPAMSITSPRVAGAVLIIAGGYQLTPLKHACLEHCESPMAFLMTHWHEGARGAFRMGVRHGLYCLGCCWALMLVLFAVGVMNLIWIAVLTVFVLAERTGRLGSVVSRAGGIALAGLGIYLVVTGATLGSLPR